MPTREQLSGYGAHVTGGVTTVAARIPTKASPFVFIKVVNASFILCVCSELTPREQKKKVTLLLVLLLSPFRALP